MNFGLVILLATFTVSRAFFFDSEYNLFYGMNSYTLSHYIQQPKYFSHITICTASVASERFSKTTEPTATRLGTSYSIIEMNAKFS